ncbi:MAG: ParB N-terminal domain-containing protein [Actinobacteria bacterium]|nr:ParB N-terminal domain-containing protein [Actinomycetota bacterium]
MTTYIKHELNIMPDISGPEWTAFVASVKASGQVHPIMLYQGKILDGWQRYRACAELGIEPKVAVFEGDDEAAWAYFLGMNFRRAQYSPDQLAMVAAELEPLLDAQRPKQLPLFEDA